jgi:hypothetical protein
LRLFEVLRGYVRGLEVSSVRKIWVVSVIYATFSMSGLAIDEARQDVKESAGEGHAYTCIYIRPVHTNCVSLSSLHQALARASAYCFSLVQPLCHAHIGTWILDPASGYARGV